MRVFDIEMGIKEVGASAVQAALAKLKSGLADTTKEAGKTDDALGRLADAGKKLASALAIGATFAKIIDASSQAQFVQAQLAAALRSTGNAAGTSVEALNDHAEALSRLSVFDDEAIGGAQALLLTFTKIRGEIFPRATEAILNVAQAMGGDLRGAAIQVGKALNDPVLGLTALSRSGIQFSEAQKVLIKSLVETGNVAEAQRIILQELEVQFGGSAAAARDTLGGAIQGLKNDFDNLFELGTEDAAGLVMAVNSVAIVLRPLAGAIGQTIAVITGGLTTITTSLNNIFLAFMRLVNRIVQFFANFGGQLVKIGAMFTGRLTPEFDRAVDSWLEGFDHTETALIEQQAEWKTWEQGIYDRLAGVRQETAKPITPPSLGGGGGGGRRTGSPTIEQLGPAPAATIFRPETMAVSVTERFKRIAATMRPAMAPVLTEVQKMDLQLRDTFANSVSTAIVAGFSIGIENAIASGNIGEGFKALTTVMLAGLGDAMVQFGTASLAASELMTKIQTSLASLLPGGATVASIAMIALGAALKGTARAAFGRGGGGGGGGAAFSSISFGGGMTSGQTTQLIFGSTSATTAAGMQPRSATNVTIIGPNDPSAQRAMQELLAKANSRGRVG